MSYKIAETASGVRAKGEGVQERRAADRRHTIMGPALALLAPIADSHWCPVSDIELQYALIMLL